jgi:hypothetical protein
MLIKEAAERLGKTDRAIYRHIERQTPLGKIFKKNKFGRWTCLKRDLNRFLAVMK